MRGMRISWIRGMSKQGYGNQGRSRQIFLAKAASKLRVAEYALQQKEYETSASLLYYALFHTMQSVLGLPPQGAWKHVAIAKVFNSYCYHKQLFPQEMLGRISRMYHELYDFRKQSDYSAEPFTDEMIEKLNNHYTLFKQVLSCLQRLKKIPFVQEIEIIEQPYDVEADISLRVHTLPDMKRNRSDITETIVAYEMEELVKTGEMPGIYWEWAQNPYS
jgi:uncharacterized protein (UPF0332 family)